jgi:hypothetical protein
MVSKIIVVLINTMDSTRAKTTGPNKFDHGISLNCTGNQKRGGASQKHINMIWYNSTRNISHEGNTTRSYTKNSCRTDLESHTRSKKEKAYFSFRKTQETNRQKDRATTVGNPRKERHESRDQGGTQKK